MDLRTKRVVCNISVPLSYFQALFCHAIKRYIGRKGNGQKIVFDHPSVNSLIYEIDLFIQRSQTVVSMN